MKKLSITQQRNLFGFITIFTFLIVGIAQYFPEIIPKIAGILSAIICFVFLFPWINILQKIEDKRKGIEEPLYKIQPYASFLWQMFFIFFILKIADLIDQIIPKLRAIFNKSLLRYLIFITPIAYLISSLLLIIQDIETGKKTIENFFPFFLAFEGMLLILYFYKDFFNKKLKK